MLNSAILRAMAAERLQDAQTLLSAGRYDGATYLCGYVVEFTLKARICDTLNWSEFPPQSKGASFTNFTVHKLPVLLLLSGRESNIIPNFIADWSIVKDWDPQQRYGPIGQFSESDAKDFLRATINLIQQL